MNPPAPLGACGSGPSPIFISHSVVVSERVQVCGSVGGVEDKSSGKVCTRSKGVVIVGEKRTKNRADIRQTLQIQILDLENGIKGIQKNSNHVRAEAPTTDATSRQLPLSS
jgi:hypothetical protein